MSQAKVVSFGEAAEKLAQSTSPYRPGSAIGRALGWVRRDVAAGGQTGIAVTKAVQAIVARGLATQFVQEIGEEFIRRLWRQELASKRDYSASKPRAPKIDPNVLSQPCAILESLHQVEGRWLRLGDMWRSDCISAALLHRRVAEVNTRRAEAFEELAKRLPASGSVREMLEEFQVRKLFERTGLV